MKKKYFLLIVVLFVVFFGFSRMSDKKDTGLLESNIKQKKNELKFISQELVSNTETKSVKAVQNKHLIQKATNSDTLTKYLFYKNLQKTIPNEKLLYIKSNELITKDESNNCTFYGKGNFLIKKYDINMNLLKNTEYDCTHSKLDFFKDGSFISTYSMEGFDGFIYFFDKNMNQVSEVVLDNVNRDVYPILSIDGGYVFISYITIEDEKYIKIFDKTGNLIYMFKHNYNSIMNSDFNFNNIVILEYIKNKKLFKLHTLSSSGKQIKSSLMQKGVRFVQIFNNDKILIVFDNKIEIVDIYNHQLMKIIDIDKAPFVKIKKIKLFKDGSFSFISGKSSGIYNIINALYYEYNQDLELNKKIPLGSIEGKIQYEKIKNTLYITVDDKPFKKLKIEN